MRRANLAGRRVSSSRGARARDIVSFRSLMMGLGGGFALAAPVSAQSEGAPVAVAEGRLEEVVVTAQKEEQILQRAPAAVTAISDALIASGVTDLRAAQMLAPAV